MLQQQSLLLRRRLAAARGSRGSRHRRCTVEISSSSSSSSSSLSSSCCSSNNNNTNHPAITTANSTRPNRYHRHHQQEHHLWNCRQFSSTTTTTTPSSSAFSSSNRKISLDLQQQDNNHHHHHDSRRDRQYSETTTVIGDNGSWEARVKQLIEVSSLSSYYYEPPPQPLGGAEGGNATSDLDLHSTNLRPSDILSEENYDEDDDENNREDGWEMAQQLLLEAADLSSSSTMSSSNSSSSNDIDPSLLDPSKVILAFTLLDRMVQEERSSTIGLDYRILNHMVDWWRRTLRAEYKQQQQQQHLMTHNNNNNNNNNIIKPSSLISLLRPSQLVAKLDHYRSTSTSFQPNTRTYNMVLDAAASTYCNNTIDNHNNQNNKEEVEDEKDDDEDGIYFCQNLMEWMIQEGQRDVSVRPDAITFRTLMRAWTFSGVDDELSMNECERLAQRWYDYTTTPRTMTSNDPEYVYDNDDDNDDDLSVGKTTIAAGANTSIVTKGLIHAYAAAAITNGSSSSSLLTNRAEHYLIRMAQEFLEQQQEELQKEDTESHQLPSTSNSITTTDFPETTLWNRVISAHAKTGQPQRAQDLLNQYLRLYKTAMERAEDSSWAGDASYTLLQSLCRPNVLSYNHVLDGWTRAENVEGAESLLETMHQWKSSPTFAQCRPNEASYTTVMKANLYNLPRVETCMEQFLTDYQQQEQENEEDQQRQRRQFEEEYSKEPPGLVIHPFETPRHGSMNGDGSYENESHGHRRGREGRLHLSLDVTIFNVWLAACAKAGRVDRATSILLKDMPTWNVEPDAISYSCILQTFRTASDPNGALDFWKTQILPNVTINVMDSSPQLQLQDEQQSPVLDPDDLVTWIATIVQLQDRKKQQSNGTALIEEFISQYLLPTRAEPSTWNRLLAMLQGGNPERLDAILGSMPTPTAESYRITLRSWANSSHPHATDRSESLLRQWQEQSRLSSAPSDSQSQDSTVTPTVDLYTSVMTAWAKRGDVRRTKALFDELYGDFQQTGDRSLQPQVATMTTVLQACANAVPNPQVEQAEAFLADALAAYEGGKLDTKPDVVMFNIVLNCWAKTKSRQSGRRAEAIYKQMEEPDMISFNTVVNSYVRAGQLDHAERMVQTLISKFQQVKTGEGQNEEKACMLRPDLATMRTILTGWTRSRARNAPQRAEAFLCAMQGLYRTGVLDVSPDLRCYGLAMQAWANSNSPDAGERAEAILCEALEQAASSETQMGYSKNERLPSVATELFDTAILAYRGYPDKARALLDQMCGEFLQGNEMVKPDRKAFEMVLESYLMMAPSALDAAERAENLLSRMKAMYEAGQLDSAKPTIDAYTIVLKCWDKSSSKVPDVGVRAEALLRDMQTYYQPPMESYKPVLYAMANRGNLDRTETLFQELLDAYRGNRRSSAARADALKPDMGCFNALLVACRAAKKAERATVLLRGLEEGGDDSMVDLKLHPTARTYNLVLACLADRGMGSEAEGLLQRMQVRGVVPTIVSFNTVLNAWANAGTPEAVLHAERLVEEMAAKPNERTYITLLKVISASSVPGKQQKFQKVQERMKQAGYQPRNIREFH